MTTVLRRWRRRLTGPLGQRVLLALALAAAWVCWAWLPPHPLVAWEAPLEQAYVAFLARDGSTILTVGSRQEPDFRGGWGFNGPHGPVRLWDAATGRERLCVLDADTPLSFDEPALFAPDGSWLLTHDLRGGVLLWDPASGRRRAELRPPGERRGQDGYPKLVVSADGRVIAGERPDQRAVLLWDSATGCPLATLEGASFPLTFTPDSRAVLTATPGTSGKFWGAATGHELFDLPGHPSPFGAVAVSPDGRMLATGLHSHRTANHSAPTAVKLWDAGTGAMTGTLDVREQPENAVSLDFSPDGSLLVIRSYQGRGLLWDVTTDPPRNRDDLLALTEYESRAKSYLRTEWMSFAPDGRRWWVSVDDRWSLARAEPPNTPPRVVTQVGRNAYAIAPPPVYSPDGRVFAVLVYYGASDMSAVELNLRAWVRQVLGPLAGDDPRGAVRLFDAASGRRLATLRAPGSNDGHGIFGFTPDGQALWTTRTTGPGIGDTKVFEQWAVPTGWPPLWLLGITPLGVLLAVADWRRSRRTAIMEPGGRVT